MGLKKKKRTCKIMKDMRSIWHIIQDSVRLVNIIRNRKNSAVVAVLVSFY